MHIAYKYLTTYHKVLIDEGLGVTRKAGMSVGPRGYRMLTAGLHFSLLCFSPTMVRLTAANKFHIYKIYNVCKLY